jgi:thioredoxin 1
MNKMLKLGIIFIVAVAAAGVFAYKVYQQEASGTNAAVEVPAASAQNNPEVIPAALPVLLDLGSHSCIPCKMMMPILDELKKEYTGIFKVEFIDIKDNPVAGDKYNLEAIPTQIFIDASGKELFRHVGFFPKEEILKKWRELGVGLQGKNNK